MNGKNITLTIKDDDLYINDNAKVIKTDIITSNGIIHVIDNVLIQCVKCKYAVCSKCKYNMKLKCPICDR